MYCRSVKLCSTILLSSLFALRPQGTSAQRVRKRPLSVEVLTSERMPQEKAYSRLYPV